MLACPLCPGRTFSTSGALHQHQIDSKNHFYCPTCSNGFPDPNALFDHATIVHSRTCVSCRRSFASEKGVERHLYDSPKHPKCRSCRIGFRDCAALDVHKSEVHGNQSSRRRRSRRPFSPTTNTEYSATPSPTLRSQSPTSSVTSRNSDRVDAARRMLAVIQDGESGIPVAMSTILTIADGLEDTISPRINGLLEGEEYLDEHGSTSHCQVQKTATLTDRSPTSSLRLGEVHDSLPLDVKDLHIESMGISQPNQNSRNGASTSADTQSTFSTPLFETNLLPSDSNSDSSSDNGVVHVHSRNTRESPSQHCFSQTRHESEQCHNEDDSTISRFRERPASFATIDLESQLTEAMRAARRALCDAALRSVSPRRLGSPSSSNSSRTLFQLSRLPTIADEPEVDLEEELNHDQEALEALPDAREVQRPAGRRKRRLSLTPSLPSIPEATLSQGIGSSSPIDRDDSDSDSSQGIYEHRAGDFLFDSPSDNERSQTPMTYLTADELDFDADMSTNPSSPLLLIEDLTKLIDEMTPPSTADGDFFDSTADPFELHPSANNSPMSATFPKRLRAWSLSAPQYDPGYLTPEAPKSESEDSATRKEDEAPEETAAGETEADVKEPDEMAISADEPPPAVIEDDLFSEPDEIMGPILQEAHTIEPIVDADEAQFAEEGHPLRSIISLDVLPARRKGPISSYRSQPATQSRLQEEDDLTLTTNTSNHESTSERKSILRCRICQVDPCREATATFCGHIFCNECIVQEIMAKSKCPVCNVPTLLYCLFKLDLNS